MGMNAVKFNQVLRGVSTSRIVLKPWFMAVSVSSKKHLSYMRASLSSGLAHSNMYPIVLISGDPSSIPTWLLLLNRSCRALVIGHNLTFSTRIARSAPHVMNHPAYLRLDIPNVLMKINDSVCSHIDLNYNYGLYTDTDIIFTSRFNIESLPEPKVIMIGGETKKGKRNNSGILYINITAIRQHFPKLLTFADKYKWNFEALDQGLIMKYYKHVSQLLPDIYNWKPYWGINHQACIIHFHGAKPGDCAECLATNGERALNLDCSCFVYTNITSFVYNTYRVSFAEQSRSYAHYLSMFFRYQKRLHNYLSST